MTRSDDEPPAPPPDPPRAAPGVLQLLAAIHEPDGLEPRPNPTTQVVDASWTNPTDGSVAELDTLRELRSDSYDLLEEIGSGSFSVVHRARHKRTGELVALKVLRPAASAGLIRTRLTRELDALQRIQHPNVVRVIDFELERPAPVIVFELLDGPTLRDLIAQQGSLPPEQVLPIALAIASGLEAVHATGIVHRDLKLANVVAPAGARPLKIIDFGLVRLADADLTRITATGHLLGTPQCISPEQIRDPSSAGPPADLYALGVLLCSLLTGEPPYRRRTIAELIRAHLEAPVPPIDHHLGLGPLVSALLSKDPSARPTAGQLREAILELGGTQAGLTEGGASPSRLTEGGASPSRLTATFVPTATAPQVSIVADAARRERLRSIRVGAAAFAVTLAAAAVTIASLRSREAPDIAARAPAATPTATPAPAREPPAPAPEPAAREPPALEPPAREPPPRPEPSPELAPVDRPAERANASSAPAPAGAARRRARAEAPKALDADLEPVRVSLAEQGLALGDLSWIAPAEWARLSRAGAAGPARSAAIAELSRRASSVVVDPRTAHAALDRVLEVLRTRDLDDAQARAAERRYFELRDRVAEASGSKGGIIAVLRETSELARALGAARPPPR